MRDFRDAKAMAQTLRDTLRAKSVSLTHSESLEIIAKTFGVHDWNVLAAAIQASQSMLAPPRKSPIRSPGDSILLPVAPMRDVVFFPHAISPIWVGREKTRRAIDAAIAGAGVTRVLSYQAAQAIADGRLVAVLAEYEPEPFPVSLVYPAGRLVPLKLRAFLDFAAPRLKSRLQALAKGP